MKERLRPTERPLDKLRKYTALEYKELPYKERCLLNYTEKKGWYDSVMAQRLCEYLEQCKDFGNWTYSQLAPMAVYFLETQSSGTVYSYSKYTVNNSFIKKLLTSTPYSRGGGDKKRYKLIKENAIKSVELNAEIGVVCSKICLTGAKRYLKYLNSEPNMLIPVEEFKAYASSCRNVLTLIAQFPFFTEPQRYEIHDLNNKLQVKLVSQEEMESRNQKLIDTYVQKTSTALNK